MSKLKRPKGKAAWKRWANKLRMKAKHPDAEKMIPVDGEIPLAKSVKPIESKSALDLLNDL